MLTVLNVERFKSLGGVIKGGCGSAPPHSCPRKRRSNTSKMSTTSSSSEEEVEDNFKYENPTNGYTQEFKVSLTLELTCPGCGLMMKQVLRHMKACYSIETNLQEQKDFSMIDFKSFEKQLKLFRNRKLHKRQRDDAMEEDREKYTEKMRKEQEEYRQKKREKDPQKLRKEQREEKQKERKQQKVKAIKERLQRQKEKREMNLKLGPDELQALRGDFLGCARECKTCKKDYRTNRFGCESCNKELRDIYEETAHQEKEEKERRRQKESNKEENLEQEDREKSIKSMLGPSQSL